MWRRSLRQSREPVKRTFDRAARSLGEFPAQFWLLTAGILVYVVGVDMCFPFETLFPA